MPPKSPAAAKDLVWTPELVARFWDEVGTSPKTQELYFTNKFGAQIVDFLENVVDLRSAAVLDYGCGPGFLAERLLATGATVTGADYSPETVKAINARFAGEKGWRGAVQIVDGHIEADSDSFDLTTCIETVEHMFEDARSRLLSELLRVLKPGGRLMVSTPYEENLDELSAFCPQCQSRFHTVQHLSSWSKASLSKLLTEGGFVVEFCEGIDLAGLRPEATPWLDKSIRQIFRGLRDALRETGERLADRISPRPFPNGRVFRRRVNLYRAMNLVAVARKP